MKKLGLLRGLWLGLRALFDKRTPIWVKLLAALSVVYGVLPIDLVPDLIPLVGWLDDAGLIAGALLFASKFFPRMARRGPLQPQLGR